MSLTFTHFSCIALLAVNDKDRLLKEVFLMLNFNHPNVMSLIGLSFEGETPLLIMPFMSKGNVLGYVREHRETLFLTDINHEKVETIGTKLKCSVTIIFDVGTRSKQDRSGNVLPDIQRDGLPCKVQVCSP